MARLNKQYKDVEDIHAYFNQRRLKHYRFMFSMQLLITPILGAFFISNTLRFIYDPNLLNLFLALIQGFVVGLNGYQGFRAYKQHKNLKTEMILEAL